MNNISDVTVSPLTQSSFLKPFKMKYTQDGINKENHLLKVHNSVGLYNNNIDCSVAVLLFNTSRNVFIFVKQFRPAVYYANISHHEAGTNIETEKYPCEQGFTLELCAGIVDKEVALEEIARLEVLEECGFIVPASQFERIVSLRNVHLTGSKQTIFFAEVTDDMKCKGPTKEHETIEVTEVSVEEAKKYLCDDDVRSPAIFLFCLLWFFQNKQKMIST